MRFPSPPLLNLQNLLKLVLSVPKDHGSDVPLRYPQGLLPRLDRRVNSSPLIGSVVRARSPSIYRAIQGVGPVVSATVLAEIPDLPNFDSARQAAAYLGVVPRKRQSGSSLNRSGGITKRGNTRLRAVLYMAAIVAIKSNPVLRTFAERLRTFGKKPKVFIVAVMRKLVHILYAVAKQGCLVA
jgi:transposase